MNLMNPRDGKLKVRLKNLPGDPWEGLREDWREYLGFIYRIEHKESGKFYIGKKLFYKAAPKKGREIMFEESDWRTYWGSCKELVADVRLYGKEAYSRTIIHHARSKSELALIETWFQLNLCAGSDNTYNKIINCRTFLHPKVKDAFNGFLQTQP